MLAPEEEQLIADLQVTSDHYVRMELIGALKKRKVKTRDIVDKTGLRDYQIRHYMRVYAKTDPVVLKLFEKGSLSYSLIKAIASLDPKDQENAARESVAKRVSVHRFRDAQSVNSDQRLNDDLERMANNFSEQSGLDIQIKADAENANAGTWLIRYNSLDMFDQITEVIVGKLPGEENW